MSDNSVFLSSSAFDLTGPTYCRVLLTIILRSAGVLRVLSFHLCLTDWGFKRVLLNLSEVSERAGSRSYFTGVTKHHIAELSLWSLIKARTNHDPI